MTGPQPWDVYHFFCQQVTPAHHKFVIVTDVPQGVGYCYGIYINSERNVFQSQQRLDDCYIPVTPQDLAFLDHDSYIALDDMHTFQLSNFTVGNYRGRLSTAIVADLQAGAGACPIIRRGHRKMILGLPQP